MSKVSIIVPVYNLVSYIEECIKSIQKQTYQNLEIMIVDDGSTDGSSELCDRIARDDSRIKVIHQKNAGVVVARGRGIQEATGKYMSFVDGDDWIDPDMIKTMVEQIGNADLITMGVYEQVSSDNVVERYDEFPEGVYAGKTRMSSILSKMIYDDDKSQLQPMTPWGVNKLFLSAMVKEIYQELDSDITFAEDTVFVYKYLLRCHSIVISHQPFYHYRYRQDSALHTVNNRMLMNINRVYLALEADFRRHDLGDCLLLQLQKWILIMDCWAINGYMGFDERIYIPEFVADISNIENKRLILYGAGKVGKAAYAQFQKFGYQLVLWVDKNYEHYQSMNLPVTMPEEIFHSEYDVIYIAVSEQSVAEKIKDELSEKGISRDRMVWKEPMHIFEF